jgi:hypothetical protein
MGEVLRAYFVPNGSYLMELAEDGVGGPSVDALRAIGREIRTELRADARYHGMRYSVGDATFAFDPAGVTAGR